MATTRIENGVTIIESRGCVRIHETSGANSGTMFRAQGADIMIDANVGIGYNCLLATSYGSHYLGAEAAKRKKPIHVKENAWIGSGTMIRGGVTIGRWGVVGMGAVVLHDVPDFMVAVGNPARIVGRRPDYELILEAERSGTVPKVKRS